MDNLLLEITTSLEAIQQLSNQENREIIQNSTFHIQKNLTLFIYKMGQLEQEKINLKHKIQIKEFQPPPEKESNPIVRKVPNNTPYQRTYASVIAKTTHE